MNEPVHSRRQVVRGKAHEAKATTRTNDPERTMANILEVAMNEFAENIRAALLEEALRAYEEAGIQGVCAAGRWEAAVDAMRPLDLERSAQHSQAPPAGPPAKSL